MYVVHSFESAIHYTYNVLSRCFVFVTTSACGVAHSMYYLCFVIILIIHIDRSTRLVSSLDGMHQ